MLKFQNAVKSSLKTGTNPTWWTPFGPHLDPTARWQPPEEWYWRNLLKYNEIYLQKVAVIGAENSATFMHAGYSNILRRTEGRP